jgi:hypothetical protein
MSIKKETRLYHDCFRCLLEIILRIVFITIKDTLPKGFSFLKILNEEDLTKSNEKDFITNSVLYNYSQFILCSKEEFKNDFSEIKNGFYQKDGKRV